MVVNMNMASTWEKGETVGVDASLRYESPSKNRKSNEMKNKDFDIYDKKDIYAGSKGASRGNGGWQVGNDTRQDEYYSGYGPEDHKLKQKRERIFGIKQPFDEDAPIRVSSGDYSDGCGESGFMDECTAADILRRQNSARDNRGPIFGGNSPRSRNLRAQSFAEDMPRRNQMKANNMRMQSGGQKPNISSFSEAVESERGLPRHWGSLHKRLPHLLKGKNGDTRQKNISERGMMGEGEAYWEREDSSEMDSEFEPPGMPLVGWREILDERQRSMEAAMKNKSHTQTQKHKKNQVDSTDADTQDTQAQNTPHKNEKKNHSNNKNISDPWTAAASAIKRPGGDETSVRTESKQRNGLSGNPGVQGGALPGNTFPGVCPPDGPNMYNPIGPPQPFMPWQSHPYYAAAFIAAAAAQGSLRNNGSGGSPFDFFKEKISSLEASLEAEKKKFEDEKKQMEDNISEYEGKMKQKDMECREFATQNQNLMNEIAEIKSKTSDLESKTLQQKHEFDALAALHEALKEQKKKESEDLIKQNVLTQESMKKLEVDYAFAKDQLLVARETLIDARKKQKQATEAHQQDLNALQEYRRTNECLQEDLKYLQTLNLSLKEQLIRAGISADVGKNIQSNKNNCNHSFTKNKNKGIDNYKYEMKGISGLAMRLGCAKMQGSGANTPHEENNTQFNILTTEEESCASFDSNIALHSTNNLPIHQNNTAVHNNDTQHILKNNTEHIQSNPQGIKLVSKNKHQETQPHAVHENMLYNNAQTNTHITSHSSTHLNSNPETHTNQHKTTHPNTNTNTNLNSNTSTYKNQHLTDQEQYSDNMEAGTVPYTMHVPPRASPVQESTDTTDSRCMQKEAITAPMTTGTAPKIPLSTTATAPTEMICDGSDVHLITRETEVHALRTPSTESTTSSSSSCHTYNAQQPPYTDSPSTCSTRQPQYTTEYNRYTQDPSTYSSSHETPMHREKQAKALEVLKTKMRLLHMEQRKLEAQEQQILNMPAVVSTAGVRGIGVMGFQDGNEKNMNACAAPLGAFASVLRRSQKPIIPPLPFESLVPKQLEQLQQQHPKDVKCLKDPFPLFNYSVNELEAKLNNDKNEDSKEKYKDEYKNKYTQRSSNRRELSNDKDCAFPLHRASSTSKFELRDKKMIFSNRYDTNEYENYSRMTSDIKSARTLHSPSSANVSAQSTARRQWLLERVSRISRLQGLDQIHQKMQELNPTINEIKQSARRAYSHIKGNKDIINNEYEDAYEKNDFKQNISIDDSEKEPSSNIDNV